LMAPQMLPPREFVPVIVFFRALRHRRELIPRLGPLPNNLDPPTPRYCPGERRDRGPNTVRDDPVSHACASLR
jgi:hypothetical protein